MILKSACLTSLYARLFHQLSRITEVTNGSKVFFGIGTCGEATNIGLQRTPEVEFVEKGFNLSTLDSRWEERESGVMSVRLCCNSA